MSLRDSSLAITVGGTFAAVADLFVNGGDVLLMGLELFLDQSGLVYLIVGRLAAAAPNVPWLPAGLLQTASTAIALVTAAYGLYRLLKNISNRRNTNS